MKITIPRGELKEAVTGLGKVVNSRTALPILNSVRFDATKDAVTAQATDLDQVVLYRFQNAQVACAGTCIVPFQILKDLTKGPESENIELELLDAENATVINHVGQHALRRNVPCLPVIDWPPMGAEIQTSLADRFLPTYRRLAPFVSVDATRRVLNGVYVDVASTGEHNVTLVATDGRRLTCCNSLKLPLATEAGMIMPVTKFLTWTALGDDASIGRDKETLALETGPWTYQTKLTDGVYPNWRQVIPNKDVVANQFAFTDADVDAIKKIMPSLPGGECIAIDGAANGKITLVAHGKDDKNGSTAQLAGGSKHTGSSVRIHVSRRYLLDALNAGFRNFAFADGHSPLRADDGAGAIHVLMPLRTDAAPSPAPEPAPAPEPTPEPAATINPTPAVETQPETPKENTMTHENAPEPSGLEKLQAAYDVAKSKVREASQALAEVADAIKLTAREDRQRRNEVETVRAGLQKLQSIRV